MPGFTRRRSYGVPALTALGAASALFLGLVAPVAADSPGQSAVAAATSAAPASIGDGDGIELWRDEQPVAPGMDLTSYQRREADKWLSAHVLSMDLTENTEIDYLHSGDVAGAAPVSELVRGHDPGEGRTTVAAINGDFFDIQATDAPLGPGINDGELANSPSDGNSQALAIDAEGAGSILDLYFDGTVTLPDAVAELSGYNAARLPADGIGMYTAQWGTADRALPVGDAQEIAEVVVEDGSVTAVSDQPGDSRPPEGAAVLLGRDAGAEVLATLDIGETVTVEYAVRTDEGSDVPRTAIGGRGLLVVDGEPQDWEGLPNNPTAPRTAVGFSADGLEMHVLTVDGRQPHSDGTTLTELGVLMADLGAENALNLDGGGSTTLLTREPGASEPRLVNRPSDGHERDVPNGLAVTVPEGSGQLSGFQVAPQADPLFSPADGDMAQGRPERVFPGLTRQLRAAGHDETYGPADSAPHWRSGRPSIGRVSADGVFDARRPGTVKVTASQGRASGSAELTVLGELHRLRPTQQRVGLADPAAQASFGLLGTDFTGASAPIEPGDVALDYDTSLFDIVPDVSSGGFTVRAVTADEFASTQVTATVGDISTILVVTIGLEDLVTADFEDAANWEFSHARGGGALAPEPEGHDGMALRMTYDFTQSTGTRAAYAAPPADIPVPGQPQSFTMWIHGDGNGSWPSLHLKDTAGTDQVLRTDHIGWEGWQQVTFEVPQGLAYPLSVHRFYIAETQPDLSYEGEIMVDGLSAQIPPESEIPSVGPHIDPLISTQADMEGRDWQFAVVSDAQFVARDPDSETVELARRTLRDARAADPDFIMINGDWVDEGSREDLEFAKDMIEEELGNEVPWHYIPGNHEIMGGSIDLFTEVFGETQLTFDHKGTRFITLDTSSLTIGGAGHEQFLRLREQLDAAAQDRSVGSVLVMSHTPPRDTTAQPASQLTDRMEALLLEKWLAEFRQETGKGTAFFGAHVGIFDSYRLDGVAYFIGGDAGKAPASAPDEGGFTGWAMVGVDEVSRNEQERGRLQPHLGLPDWLSVQTRAHVDELALHAPGTLAVGESAGAGASLVQETEDGSREVPVGYPVSADWSGSKALFIGSPDDADHRHSAAFDPATGELTGLRAGSVTLEVWVSGESQRAKIRVTR